MVSMDNTSKRIIAGIVLFAIGAVMHFVLHSDWQLQLLVFGIGYIVVGYDVVLSAVRNIGHGQVFDENFLMTVATIGAFILGEFPEGMAVMLFFQIGEWFEHLAVRRTRRSISDLMDIQPQYANLVDGDSVERVDPEDVSVDDVIEVRPGERIPLDGIVIEGSTSVDTKALTGESVPRDLVPGDAVISGTVNLTSVVRVRVTHDFEDSTVSKVLELVEESVSRKARMERFITRFARWYTPLVVFSALLVAVIPVLLGQDPSVWVYRALTFLVVSCPCALVISVPLAYFCGIGASSKMGILVKGGNYLEALSRCDTMVFDKTGTLTEGRFEVVSVDPVGCSEEELLETAARVESVSNHPIARSIADSFKGPNAGVDSAEEVPGKGMRAMVDGREVLVGNHRLMTDSGITADKVEHPGTVVHVARDGAYMGCISLSDVLKADSATLVRDLKDKGVRRTVMLSGDDRRIGEDVASRVGIDEARCELLPGDKMRILEEIMEDSDGTVAFVGDGMNDAPSLARADIGIAMGGLGSDAAIEAADVVVMDDSPGKIAVAMDISRRTRSIVIQNIVFALGVKFIILVAAVLGYANMWVAVFGDVGVAVLAILNSMRCLNTRMYRR